MIEFFNNYKECCLNCGCESFKEEKDVTKAKFILVCAECGCFIKTINKKSK